MCNTPHCCLPQESGPCLSPSVAAHPLRPATRHRLGGPSPHQQADRPRAHPPPKHHNDESFPTSPCGPTGTPRISRPFKRLSRRGGQVAHVILTRSPLNPPPKKETGPFDLHVLSTPPAFVLSQDQTLQTKPEQPTTNTNPRNQARTGTGPGRTTEAGEKTPTQPDTPQNPPTPTRPRRPTPEPEEQRAPSGKKHAQPPTTQQDGEEPGATRPPRNKHEKAGPSTPNPPPTLDNRWRPGAPHRPPNPEPPATRPPHPRTTAQKNHEEQEQRTTPNPRTKNQADNQNNPQKHRRNPSHPPKPRTQNMTHYRDLKQHTQPMLGRPLDPLRSGKRHPPSYGKRFTAVNLKIIRSRSHSVASARWGPPSTRPSRARMRLAQRRLV